MQNWRKQGDCSVAYQKKILGKNDTWNQKEGAREKPLSKNESNDFPKTASIQTNDMTCLHDFNISRMGVLGIVESHRHWQKSFHI